MQVIVYSLAYHGQSLTTGRRCHLGTRFCFSSRFGFRSAGDKDPLKDVSAYIHQTLSLWVVKQDGGLQHDRRNLHEALSSPLLEQMYLRCHSVSPVCDNRAVVSNFYCISQ